MTDAELGMEAYVVVGNALHLLLRGMPTEARRHPSVDEESLTRLDAELSPVAPGEMLAALCALTAPDRHLLADACLAGLHFAGSEAEAVLGAPAGTVRTVAAWLCGGCRRTAGGDCPPSLSA